MSHHVRPRTRNLIATAKFVNYCTDATIGIAIDDGLNARAAKTAGRYAATLIRAGQSARSAMRSAIKVVNECE